VLLTALLVLAFVLALQIFVNRERSSQLANEKSIFFHKKWPRHLLTTTTTFLLPLFSSGTRSATFFGHNRVSQNIPLAVELAASCDQPDARWLTETCAGKDVNTAEDAKRVFSAVGQNDARALCFVWLCGAREDLAPLCRSAELGFAFALAMLAGSTFGDEKIANAQLAASKGERDGFLWLGLCFRDGEGCEEDLDKAKENFLLASALGHVSAMSCLGEMLEDSDPQRWDWLGKAAALGAWGTLLNCFVKQVRLFHAGSGSSATVMFAIGRALRGHVDEEASSIFRGGAYYFDACIGPAKQAIAFYEAQIKATKDAMRAWSLVGIYFNLVKDVRKLTAKLIWESREEALFKT